MKKTVLSVVLIAAMGITSAFAYTAQQEDKKKGPSGETVTKAEEKSNGHAFSGKGKGGEKDKVEASKKEKKELKEKRKKEKREMKEKMKKEKKEKKEHKDNHGEHRGHGKG